MFYFLRISSIITVVFLMIMITGCSGSGKNPASPELPSGNLVAETQDIEGSDGIVNGLLGVYRISIDLNTMESEIIPNRKLDAIGDTAMPDVTQYFLSTPCGSCFGIDSLGITSEGNLDIIFKMMHPYQDTSSRKDLNVFDVRGIMILEGNTSFDSLPHIDMDGDGFVDQPPMGNFTKLANADGYTYHYDNAALDLYGLNIDGSLNPYRDFFIENNPDADFQGVNIPWHKMAQGGPFDKKHYILNLDGSGEILDFVFVIECAYGQSAMWSIAPGNEGSRDNPMYFNPEFNRKEAYGVTVDPIQNLAAGDSGSQTTVSIYVRDWQNSQGTGWDLDDLGSIRYRSDVASVYLSVPDISSTLYTATSPDSGNGTNLNPYLFTFVVMNDNSAPEGEYTGLIAVMDQFQEDGRVVYGITPEIMFTTFTNYKAITLITEEGFVNTDPVAVGSANPNVVDSGQSLDLIDIDSYDNDAGDYIANYEWDYDDSDGVAFLDSVSTQPDQASTSYSNTSGSDILVTATLRVTDSHNASNTTEVVITVHSTENNPPVADCGANPNPANHNQSVALLDIDSYDDDMGDSISKFEWDFDDSDGVDFLDSVSSLPNQANTSYQNTTGSDIQFTATLRVTDSFQATDTCEVVITVHTEDTNNNDPIAVANANPNPVTSGRSVSFIDIISFDPDDPPDYIVAYRWDSDIFDGVNWEYESDQPNQSSHIYINTGLDPLQFTARLQVEDSHGATGEDDITITVNPNNLPVAVCDADPNPIRGGLEIHLLDAGSYDPDPGGGIIKFEWDFDYDGVTFDIEFTDVNPDQAYHTYENTSPDPIIYTAAVMVTDTSLTTDICEIEVAVNPNQPPTAVGYADPDTIYGNTSTTLHAEGSYDDDPGDFISRIEWDFEYDGNFVSDWFSLDKNDTISHQYANDTGSQIQVTAMLRVYDEAGVTDDAAVIINVDPPLPVPIITHTENKTSNSIGREFTMQSFNIDSTSKDWNDGPWDFTDAPNAGQYVERYVNPATDPDFAPFLPDYPTATVVYKIPDSVNGGIALAPRYYEDIALPDVGNQAELGQENTLYPTLLSMPFNNPVKIPFPMQMGYYEYLVGTGMIAEIVSFTMTFTITSRGYGMCTTEEGTYNCLLMRTYLVFSVSGYDPEYFVTYEWLSDDGTKIATASTKQFDGNFEPTGMIKGAQLIHQN